MEALRQIVAKFKADLTPLDDGLDKSEKKIGGFEATLKKLGAQIVAAFAVKAIYDFTFGLIHSADAIAKQADALGQGIREWQEWIHTADLSGVQTELLAMSFGKLNLQLNEAATKGTGPAAEALKVLGLEAETAEGKLKSAGQIIEEVADAIQGMDVVERNAQLMKLFGEQGTKLVPMLKNGSAGIKAMRAEVEALGFAFDEDFARGAEAFDDNVDRLQKGFKGLVIQGLGPLLPDLIALTGHLVSGAKAAIPMARGIVQFVRETKILQAVLAMLSVKGITVVGKALAAWVLKMGGLRGILLRVIPLVWKFIAPLLILEDLFVFLAGGKSEIGKQLDKAFGKGTAAKVRELALAVGDFVADFKRAPEKIRAAFKDLAKDMEARFGALGSFFGKWGQNLVEAGLFAVSMLTGGWENFGAKLEAIGQWALAALNIVWTEIKFGGLTVAASISDAFMTAWNSIISGAQTALNAIAKVTGAIPGLGSAAEKLGGLAKSVGGMKGEAKAGEAISAEWDQARMAIVADIEAAVALAKSAEPAAQNVARGKAPPVTNVSNNVTNTNTVQVTVPPGTPESQARNVAAAASRGISQGTRENHRATLDALTPSPG